LYTVYLHHRTTGTDNAKVCVYTDDGDALPDAGDNLLVCSNVITGNANAVYYDAAMTANPLVATSTGYWVCLISDPATGWDSFNAETGLVQKYLAVGGSYAAPPATLDGAWGNNTSKALEAYVTVGD
jgi:hypothetical protein